MATADPDLDEALHAELGVLLRRIPEDQLRKFEGYAAEIFHAFGMDLDTPATHGHPATLHPRPVRRHRRLRWRPEAAQGVPDRVPMASRIAVSARSIEGPIQFFALCEHHALPFFGHAYVGYIAHEQIIGISKLTRLVRLFAQRFTVQERIGQQIVETLEAMLRPARRGGVPGGAPPVHRDAGRARHLGPDPHGLLARRVCQRSDAARLLHRLWITAMSDLERFTFAWHTICRPSLREEVTHDAPVE